MSPRTGRPKIDNPKSIQIKFLADKQFVEKLDHCADMLKLTRSEVIRYGVEKVSEEVENNAEDN